jgi:hypothetical protein
MDAALVVADQLSALAAMTPWWGWAAWVMVVLGGFAASAAADN